jgi:hypothetical protein
MTTPALEAGTTENLLDNQIESFLEHLRTSGYAQRTLRKKRTVARAFARWMKRKQITLNDLSRYGWPLSLNRYWGTLAWGKPTCNALAESVLISSVPGSRSCFTVRGHTRSSE